MQNKELKTQNVNIKKDAKNTRPFLNQKMIIKGYSIKE